MVLYNFNSIRTVPSSNDFLDIVLSKTQRKTPTVVHQGYAIGRIRAFYMRKVRFAAEAFVEKLGWILDDFPKIDDVHPFLADLCNVLYDRDHYKLALGQLNICKSLISSVSKDYVRLLKYGDSLYRCKQLKRAALGRMATLLKKHKNTLGYLEEVRKHLTRLPTIDPNTRTLLVTGYPNVGKSSFMNKVTRADVEVQPYAFTTKSLYVGHMDHQYLKWQVIDTPGILDRPLEERNTIEMQAVTALAHLHCCVLYFVDLSEQCGWTLEQQIALFRNIQPLFANKPVVIVANKIDVMPFENLPADHRSMLESAAKESGAEIVSMSAVADLNVVDVKNRACEMLLERRVEIKNKGKKLEGVLNRLTVARPEVRDEKKRPNYIPESVKQERSRRAAQDDGEVSNDMDIDDGQKTRKTEKDLMWEQGGPGVYSCDYRKYYMLPNPEHKFDRIPEIINGQNIADFVDPEIMTKLEELEKEEEERMSREEADLEAYENAESDLDEEEKHFVDKIRAKKKVIVDRHRREKGKNRTSVYRKHQLQQRDGEEVVSSMLDDGHDEPQAKQVARGRKRDRSEEPRARDSSLAKRSLSIAQTHKRSDRSKSCERGRSRSESRVVREDARDTRGMKQSQKIGAFKKMKRSQVKFQTLGKAGEADRKHLTKMPKHLFSGKSSMKSRGHR